MRPQQQNRRMRGRNNNNNSNSGGGGGGGNNNPNRKGPNPLTRSYESNGPDVKIRGSAQQVADKYMQLARDAQGSGDRVMAENYLQHAEHYNRIIAAAQAQMPQQFVREQRDDMDDDEDGSFDGQQGFDQRQGTDGTGPQPEISGVPAEVALNPEAAGEQPGDTRPVNGNYANGQGNGGQNNSGQPNANAGEEGPRRSRRRRGRRPDGEFRTDDANASGDGESDGGGEETGLPSFVTQQRVPAAEPAPAKADKGDEQEPVDAFD